MKRIFISFAMTILAGVLLAACGGNGQAIVLSPEEQAVIDAMRETEPILPQNDAPSVAEDAPVAPQGCELTQTLQGRWECTFSELGKGGAVVFDGDSVVEYSVIYFIADRVVTQEDLDNNTPIYTPAGDNVADVWGWNISGAVQRKLISAEYSHSFYVTAWDGSAEMTAHYEIRALERREGTFAVSDETVTGSGVEWNRIEYLWNCDRGHEESAIVVNINQLGPDTLVGGRWQLARVED